MERYYDYSPEVLAELSDKEIERLIEIEIAEAGIKPVEVPQPVSLEDVGITRCEEAYEVQGLHFKNEADARTVTEMEIYKTAYDYGTGYDYKWLDRILSPAINKALFYRQEDVVRVGAALQDNERRSSIYKDAKRAYDKYLTETGKIRNDVWTVINEARTKAQALALAQTVYDKYLDLADGDEEVAKRFFFNAYKDDEEIMNKIAPASEHSSTEEEQEGGEASN